MYYQNNICLTINYSKDTLVVSALIPSRNIIDLEKELNALQLICITNAELDTKSKRE